jgi:hypothetical protein
VALCVADRHTEFCYIKMQDQRFIYDPAQHPVLKGAQPSLMYCCTGPYSPLNQRRKRTVISNYCTFLDINSQIFLCVKPWHIQTSYGTEEAIKSKLSSFRLFLEITLSPRQALYPLRNIQSSTRFGPSTCLLLVSWTWHSMGISLIPRSPYFDLRK